VVLSFVRCPPEGQEESVAPFYLGQTDVTNAQFGAFADDPDHPYKTVAERRGNGWVFPRSKTDQRMSPQSERKKISWRDFPGKECPVIEVSQEDALAFCQWFYRKTGKRAQLPTAQQRTFAALAGRKGAFWWGDQVVQGAGRMNCADATLKSMHASMDVVAFDDKFCFVSPVHQFEPNPWHLYDMFGNVDQWLGDPVEDLPGWGLIAGGSWQSTAADLSATHTQCTKLDEPNDSTGFRILLPEVPAQ